MSENPTVVDFVIDYLRANPDFLLRHPELFLHLSLLSNHKLLSVADDSSSLRVELSDNEVDILTCVLG